jgi:carboxyl-terminal processing protease
MSRQGVFPLPSGACRREVAGAMLGLMVGWSAATASASDPAGRVRSLAWEPGVFAPAATFAAECAVPRVGIDPSTGLPYPDTPGSTLTENNWLRSWTNDLYLWYAEIVDQDPALYQTPAYFDLLKTTATTASGAPRDRFHFTYPTAEWLALSQAGVQVGYGVQWAVVSATPPRQVVVAYTEPSSPATAPAANLSRGAEVIAIDGADLLYATDAQSIQVLNAGLSPSVAGETHQFVIRDLGAATERAVTLQAVPVTSVPVQNVGTVDTPTGRVGYFLFNDHLAPAEQALITAVGQLRAAGISDLVLDVRYNGGGYLAIASELAYMIAGPAATTGRTFEKLEFNDKHPTTDPVTGEPLLPYPFQPTSLGLSASPGQSLPTLNLSRVFVLTGPDTCSTCGKPYGFYPADNCGTTYFSIEFRGINAKGFGDYADGFSPLPTPGGDMGALTPGCLVSDDYTHALGSPAEGRFAAALLYRDSQTCPAPLSATSANRLAAIDGRVYKPIWLQNRLLSAPR